MIVSLSWSEPKYEKIVWKCVSIFCFSLKIFNFNFRSNKNNWESALCNVANWKRCPNSANKSRFNKSDLALNFGDIEKAFKCKSARTQNTPTEASTKPRRAHTIFRIWNGVVTAYWGIVRLRTALDSLISIVRNFKFYRRRSLSFFFFALFYRIQVNDDWSQPISLNPLTFHEKTQQKITKV